MLHVPTNSRAALATCVWLAGMFLGSMAPFLSAAPPEPPAPAASDEPPAPPAARSEEKGLRFRLQPADDEALPFEPLRARTPEDEARIDATALFMQAQLMQQRGDFQGAYDRLEKAAERDPQSAAIRRSLVPLAFVLNREQDAVRHALRAIELDPTDHETLRRLGLQLATQGKIEEGAELLEKAVASPKLDRHSLTYVGLMRELGVLHSALGNKEKAGKAFEVLLDALLSPARYELDNEALEALQASQPATFERIGQALLEAERFDGAKSAFEQAGRLGRWTPATLGFHLADVLSRQGKNEEALEQLQKYFDAQLQSKGRAPYAVLQRILAAQGKADELLPRVEALLERDPHNSSLLLFLADHYLAAERLDDAEKTYRASLKSGANAEGHLGLAAVYRRRNQPVELLQALVQALQARRDGDQSNQRLVEEVQAVTGDEKLLDALIEAGRQRSQGDKPALEAPEALLLAKLASEAKRIDPAVEFFRFALPRVDAPRRIGVYRELGETLHSAKRYAEAAEVFRTAAQEPLAVDNKPLRAEILLHLSQSAEFAGNTDEALESIREARQLVPENPLLHFQEGWVHLHARQWDEAIAIFEEVIRDYPEPEYRELTKRAVFSISNVYVERGDFDKGEAILEKYLAENPEDPGVNNDLGYLWADRNKNLDRAEKMIRKALEAEPENAAYLDSMGWVLYRQGKFTEAVEYLEKALSEPDDSDPTIWEHLGDVYQSLGNMEKAHHAWQKALEGTRGGTRPDPKVIERIERKLGESATPEE